MTLEEKYHIKYVNNRRYYEFDLNTKVPSLDNTVPFYFKYGNFEIYESAWNRITLAILNYLDTIEPKSEEYLLSLRYPWNDKVVFSTDRRINFSPFKGIFLNTNHTSTHAMMNIQEILKIYNVNVSECVFLIRRHPSAEPKEARDYFREKMVTRFVKTLKMKSVSQSNIEVIMGNIKKINAHLAKISPGYDDFFLFDDNASFQNYKNREIEYAEKLYFNQPMNLKALKITLNFLDDFYRNMFFYSQLETLSMHEDFVKSLDKEIEFLFNNLNTRIISANKLYSRMSILHSQKLETLGILNTVNDLYKIASTNLNKKYYFVEPYICLDYKANLTNEEIITEYIYMQDDFTIDEVNRYINKMHFKRPTDYFEFIQNCFNDFVQIDSDKFVKKSVLNLPEGFLTSLEKELNFYIKSFGNIDSKTFRGYNSLPQIHIGWNNFVLLGLVRTYMSHKFDIIYTNKSLTNTGYIIGVF